MNIFTLPQSAGGVLLGVAILLTAGFLMTRLTRRLHLPNVTGYILAGILVGPYALNLIPAWLSGGMEFVTDLALSYIAFSAGRYFRIADLKRSGGKVLAVTLAEALCAAVAAHAAFSLWVVGTMLPMWILGQAYFEPFRSSQGDAYVNEMLGLLSGGMLAVVVIGIVACAVVGALVGRAVLKKHFERAGIA